MKNFLNYSPLKNVWKKEEDKEKFFVSYAVMGPIVAPEKGIRRGMPVNHPIGGPVNLPSPLNTRWEYIPPDPSVGIL